MVSKESQDSTPCIWDSHVPAFQPSDVHLPGWEITLAGPLPPSIHGRVKPNYLTEILESILSKQVSEATLSVIQYSLLEKASHTWSESQLLSSFPCIGYKSGHTAAKVTAGCRWSKNKCQVRSWYLAHCYMDLFPSLVLLPSLDRLRSFLNVRCY